MLSHLAASFRPAESTATERRRRTVLSSGLEAKMPVSNSFVFLRTIVIVVFPSGSNICIHVRPSPLSDPSYAKASSGNSKFLPPAICTGDTLSASHLAPLCSVERGA